MLKNIRNTRTNKTNILIKSPSIKDVIYKANNVEVEGIDYEQIRIVITRNEARENTAEVVDCTDYDQEFLTAEGALDRQTGFVLRKEGVILVKILVIDHHTKMESTRKYTAQNN